MSSPVPREPGVDYETKVETIVMQDKSGQRQYEKMLRNGWEVESVTARKWARGATYLFRRPRRTPTAGQAAAKLLDKMVDTSPEGRARAQQKNQDAREALANERARTKEIIAERKEYWGEVFSKRKEKKAEKRERKAKKKADEKND